MGSSLSWRRFLLPFSLLLLQPVLQKTFAPCAVMSQPVCFAQVTANAVTKSCSNHSQCCGATSAWMSHYKKNQHIICVHGIHHTRKCGRCGRCSKTSDSPVSNVPHPVPPIGVTAVEARRCFDSGTGRIYFVRSDLTMFEDVRTPACGHPCGPNQVCILIANHVGACSCSSVGIEFVEV